MIFPPVHVNRPALLKRLDEPVSVYVDRIMSFARGYAAAFNFQVTNAYFTAFILFYLPHVPPFFPVLQYFDQPLILGDGTFNHEEYMGQRFIDVVSWLRDLELEWDFVGPLNANSILVVSEAEELIHRIDQENLLNLDDSPMGQRVKM